MKILEMPPYYLPEQISSTHLTSDLTEVFVKHGYTIENYVPTPSRGISEETRKKYYNIRYEEIYDGKVKIFRFPMWKEGRNPVCRAIRYILTNLIQGIKGCMAKDIDIVKGGSTPPIQGLLCGAVASIQSIKRKKKVPFIYILQDVFPDSLVTTGLTTKGSLLWKIGRVIENIIYKKADKIITISNSMKQNILDKGVDHNKVVVISNWINTDEVVPIDKKSNSLFEEFGIDREKFIVCYAGNLGNAQGTKVILEAAKILSSEKNIQFVIFGNGNDYNSIKDEIEKDELSNIRLYPVLSQDRVSEVYSLGDVNLITCKKGVGGSGLPSKLWSIMACNGRIIASFDRNSELADIIRKAGAGECVEPENPVKLSEMIMNEYNNRHLGVNNSRQYVIINASKEVCTKKYIDVIESLLN